MRHCVWYISRSVGPWERLAIGTMAAALRNAGKTSLTIISDGGTAGLSTESVCSWSSLTAFERAARIFSGGRLWHLWGDAPVWWPLVRTHARTVHTRMICGGDRWRGHPSYLFGVQASGGETALVPTFSAPASGSGTPDSRIYMNMSSASDALKEAVSGQEAHVVDVDSLRPDAPDAFSGVVVAGDGPSEALRAAALTMRGLTVVSLGSTFADELLGPTGCIRVREDTAEAWRDALESALSGGGTAASARHFLNTQFSVERCVDSLKGMYTVVDGR